MKTCPSCGACFDDSRRDCHRDGALLERSLPGTCRIAERYHVDQKLGAGGSGTVFRATHTGTGRTVALKILAPHLASRGEWLERFRREAAAVGRLKHPHIVDVIDFGTAETESGPLAFLAMENLAGRPLTAWLDEGPIAPGRAQVWLTEMAAAVDFAHRAGILHRDLKPDNIWIEELPGGHRRVKVLDFGLAKIAADDRPELLPAPAMARSPAVSILAEDDLIDVGRGPSLHPTIRVSPPEASSPAAEAGLVTELGVIMGTPAYMSPEQAAGEAATPASDIYSLGVIAFEMVLGELPFRGKMADLLDHHRFTAPPDPGHFRRPLPRSMRRAILSALAKDPADRPASAEAFAHQLSGSLRTDQLAVRAARLYLSLAAIWAVGFLAVRLSSNAEPAAMTALATVNVVYFLAASAALLLDEAGREAEPERLWPICLLAFPITPLWLFLVWRHRRQTANGGLLDSQRSR